LFFCHFSFGQVMVVFVLLSFSFWSGHGSNLNKRKMTKGQILPSPDQKKNDNKTNTTMNWPKEKWQQDKYYHDLTKRKMTKEQILPWPDQKKNDKRTNTTMTWPKEKWQQDKYYHELTKRKMTTILFVMSWLYFFFCHFSFFQVMVIFVLLSFFFWSGHGSICLVVIFLLVSSW
jgi:Ca2+-dependent lipid-binding protein